jgi:hypothetical protein
MAKNKQPKALTPSQANRVEMDMLLVKIRCAEQALRFTFNGKSTLWGLVINSDYVSRLKAQLWELDRKQQIYDSDKLNNMQYLPSGRSVVDKIKDHFADDDRYAFTEVRQGQSGKMVVTHTHSKSFINKQIKSITMATKKKAAKKGATVTTATKSAKTKTASKAAPKAVGDSIKSFVDGCVKKKMDNAAIFVALDKAGYAYSINSVRWYASKARGAK